MILKELLEVLNANVYFHLFSEKHIGRFDNMRKLNGQRMKENRVWESRWNNA